MLWFGKTSIIFGILNKIPSLHSNFHINIIPYIVGNSLQSLLGTAPASLPRSQNYVDVISTNRYQATSSISPKPLSDVSLTPQQQSHKSRKRYVFYSLFFSYRPSESQKCATFARQSLVLSVHSPANVRLLALPARKCYFYPCLDLLLNLNYLILLHFSTMSFDLYSG